jgi:hypothetical protein
MMLLVDDIALKCLGLQRPVWLCPSTIRVWYALVAVVLVLVLVVLVVAL